MHVSLAATCALTLTVGAGFSMMSTDDGAPSEFGAVAWGRKLEPALVKAAASEKPVMLLFQEVPG